VSDSLNSHEAVVGAYVVEDDPEDRCGIEVVCECGHIVIDEPDDELLPLSEIVSAVREHQERSYEY
jgi:hypothetical protein